MHNMHNFDVVHCTIKKLTRLVDIYVNNTHGYDINLNFYKAREQLFEARNRSRRASGTWYKGRSDTAANKRVSQSE